MDHSKVHTVLLPYVLEWQMPGLSLSLINDLQKVLDDKSPSNKLRTMAEEMEAAISLKAIGFQEADIHKAVSMLLQQNSQSGASKCKTNRNVI